MEEKPTTDVGVPAGDTCAVTYLYDNQNQNAKKRPPRFNLIKAATFMLRSRPREKAKTTETISVAKSNNKASDDNWKKIIGSMRPLHLQANRSPQPITDDDANVNDNDLSLESPATSSAASPPIFSRYASASNLEELNMAKSASTSNLQEMSKRNMKGSVSVGNLLELSGTMSRYASALNLHDLDADEEIEAEDEGEEDQMLENFTADVMIDEKAEEFISQFYQQIRHQ